MGMGYQVSSIGVLISLALTIWFLAFTVLVIIKLDKIIELLGKK